MTDFMNEVIKDLCEQGRFATAHVYKYALRSFTEFVGGGSIYFGAFSKRSLRRFQTYMEERQLSYNTISPTSACCVRSTTVRWMPTW